jgi:hypothetical protein
MQPHPSGDTHDESDPIPARLAALKTTPMPDLKRSGGSCSRVSHLRLNRRYLESRLAYRIRS